MRLARLSLVFLFVVACVCRPAAAQLVPVSTTIDPHSTPEWALIAPHLPDPVTASPAKLEMAGDILRARRFTQDAITFYKAALINGGDSATLLKKIGIVNLEMQQITLARLNFQRAVRVRKSDADAWNDLGAADYTLGNWRGSLGEYKHAIKLRKTSASFHSNLALVYFNLKDTRNARSELSKALKLDPMLLQHSDDGGYRLQILAASNYAEICFEMAHVYASQGDAESTLMWLTKAAERGYDVREAMKDDALLAPYLHDEKVKVMLANAQTLQDHNLNAKSKAPSLGSPDDKP